MSLVDNLLERLLQKSDKQDSINRATYERFAEIDKAVAVHKMECDARYDILKKEVDEHPASCPVNSTAVRKIVHDTLNKRMLEEESKELKAKRTQSVDGKWAGIIKSFHPLERMIIWLLLLYYFADKIGIIDSLFNNGGTP